MGKSDKLREIMQKTVHDIVRRSDDYTLLMYEDIIAAEKKRRSL